MHTPGPWTVDGSDIYADGLIVAQASFRLEQWEANAKLIAAAPALLEALGNSTILLQRVMNEVVSLNHRERVQGIKLYL